VKLEAHRSIDAIPEEAWNALAPRKDAPLVSWAWLDALEKSGCVGGDSGWHPVHLTLRRGKTIVAAAPAYFQESSDGDFARDWGWASSSERAGIRYYPKLSITVPFTPVTGPRFLIAPGEDRAQCIRELIEGAKSLAKKEKASSVHVLFCSPSEAREAEAAGLTRRVSFQYHWRNDGYSDPDDFLARFDSKKRNQARRERAAPSAQGIAIRTVRGDELAKDPRTWADAAYALHRSTLEKLMWGRGWLNQDFYRRVFARMAESLEIVEARRDGNLVAGAFNVATPTHLYGRYWGCFEEHKFLHFNVCLYHSIDECIRRGVQVFEGGAGGEHKLARGFEPAETYSGHYFLDHRLQLPLADYIAHEAVEREAAVARWRETTPILKHRKNT
jgi:predicted N-acyltransferase